ncbi:hypothetical protein [Pseudonocardia aurantiaca]|uniref:Uncharacterized protein n=2 Tax=Pseudonocardia aurantiaca TaxID=75290 RepID=A0ABW4FBX9_9PSEU
MRASSQNWAVLLPDILTHSVDQLRPMLPKHLAVMVVGGQVLLSTTAGQPRAVATETVGVPAQVERGGLAAVAARMLADVQDLIVTDLGGPWPLTKSGQPTHPEASLVGTSLDLRFSNKDGSDGVLLAPYPVPEIPPPTVVAG